MIRTSLLLLTVIALTASCYEPSGDNVVAVPKPTTDGMVIDLLDFGDTIFVFKDELIRFTYAGKPSLDEYEVSINGELLRTGSASPWNDQGFQLRAEGFGTGFFDLEITAIAKSNSGSLADRLDVERVSITKNYVLAIDVDPVPSEPVYLDSAKGTLRVYWEPYKKRNFIRYDLWKNCMGCVVASSDDPDDIDFLDREITIGSNFYQLVTVTSTGSHIGQKTYVYSNSQIKLESISDNTLTLTFSRPVFYSNVKEVRVYKLGQLIHTDIGFTDTTVTVDNDFPFGDNVSAAFKVEFIPEEPGKPSSRYLSYEIGRRVYTDYYNDALQIVRYNEVLNRYYFMFRDAFRVFDNDFNKIAERYDDLISFAISQNGSHMYMDLRSAGKDEYKVYATDPLTLDTTFVRVLRGTRLLRMEVSNTNLLSTNSDEYPYPSRHYVHAVPNPASIFLRNVNGLLSTISADGKHYFSYNTLYAIDGTTFTAVATISTTSDDILTIFREDDPDELLFISKAGIRAFNISTKTMRTVEVSGLFGISRCQYDPQSRCVLYNTYTGGQTISIVVDVVTGEKFTVPSQNGITFNLVNGKLISSRYYVADLSYIKSLAQ